MSFIPTAALFFISALFLSPVNACIGVGCDDVAAAVGLGVAARVGIAIGVIAVVAIVLILIIRQRKMKQMELQGKGLRPYDLESGNVQTGEANSAQNSVNSAFRYTGSTGKTSMDSVRI